MVTYLSLIVLIPLAAVVESSLDGGLGHFWDSAITEPEAVAALKLTLIASLIIVAINAVLGTMIAWVLVRDEFRGKRIVNSIIDLPFALPTIVAGLTLLALYGDDSPFGINAAYTKIGVGRGAAVRDPAVRGPGRAAGAAGARPRDGGGGGVAWRAATHGSSAASCSPT